MRPFRLKAARVPETDLHARVAEALDKLLAPPARWTTLAAGHLKLTAQQASKLQRLGLKPSWPDIQVLHEYAYGIELKAEGGRLSKTRIVRNRRTGHARVVEGQKDVFPQLEAAGMRIAICQSVEEVIAALRMWGVPLRISAGSEVVERAA